MTARFTVQDMVGKLREVVMRRPDEAMGSADPGEWHYASAVDLPAARAAHDAFIAILRQEHVAVVLHEEPLPRHADSVFVYDPVLMTDAGAVVLLLGKRLRRGEEEALARLLETRGIPIVGRLTAPAHADGGDMFWIDRDTLLVGVGFRTNYHGVEQLRSLLKPLGVSVRSFELPYVGGPEACLHLMSLVSMADTDLAVAYPPLMPVPLWQELRRRGVHLLEVPEAEFRTQATNVLAVAPRRVVVLDGNAVTRRLLEAAGCTVFAFPGEPLSFKTEGGPTCMTRALRREIG